ncbi:MAG: sugar transferase [Candidatus Subteraquimicrobiales bacterium]|nr:sugar transferase [Candidatus Subteraquimicrobiales bacterium]
MAKSKWVMASVIFDALLVNAGIVLAFLIRFGGRLPAFNFQAYVNLAIFITLIQLVCFYIYDLYEPEEIRSAWDILSAVVKATTLGLIIIVAFTFFYRFFAFPRTVFILSWFLVVFLVTNWRMFVMRVLKIKWPAQRILIVGSNNTAKEILRELRERQQWGYEVVGLVEKEKEGKVIEGAPVLGGIQDISRIVDKYKVDRVIVTIPVRHRELLEDLAKSRETYVKVEAVPELYEIFLGKVDYSLISDIPLVELTKRPVPEWVHLIKRLLDIIMSLILILITLPLMLLSVILIKLTSPGPVLYTQERVGQNEKIFTIYKFRTMIEGAEDESGPVLATENDARITKVGKFLRRYRLDELPQLFNILEGSMSFVGPRPERLFFIEKYKKEIPGYEERFKVKPGVTGLAQASGTYATTPETKLKYDLIYVYHQSIFLDIKVLAQTLKVVLTGKGAR